MHPFPELVERSGMLMSVPALALGFAIGGARGAILGGLVGFFFGMSLRSVVRTFAVDSASR